MTNIKTVLFDLGGTIIESTGPPKAYETISRILCSHGVNRSLRQIAAAHTKAGNMDATQLAVLGREYWVRSNLIMIQELGVSKNALDLARAIDKEWYDYVELTMLPDVLQTLHAFHDRGFKLGIISNGLKEELDLVLRKIGLENFFDIVVGIDTFRSSKPDKSIFKSTVKKLEVLPHEALFVGDSVEKDYEGAHSAGLNALLIDREGKYTNTDVETIRSLSELLLYIQKQCHNSKSQRLFFPGKQF